MSLVSVQGLSKSFGKTEALKEVNFSMEKGEVLGFIGPNGSGKSTTIRVLLGLLKADSGKVRIFDQDVWSDSVEIHKRVAYVPGDVNLWPNLTGGEVIDLFLSMRGQQVDYDKIASLIKAFDFDPTKKCRSYSKGNRQKVALIAAFASDADLYILDEPTSGLDPLQERVFQQQVATVKKRGASVLLSSHILSEVEQLCDTIAIIRNGSIVEAGTLNDLRHLTRTEIRLQTQKSLNHFSDVSWIHHFVQKGNQAVFQIDSNKMDQLIQALQGMDVQSLESVPPKLEDLFMRHYETTGEAGES
ncbi:ABC transporter ATP-binding protein [Marinilactibacillus sp. Marseille-P9653]|uniref:ABC transporter ATP-binding protein n=1 Tax=Marinilactibacillus sp. Marseille-P9653 TaxID=2866583 RepID=UPI001CE42087|nr:ABC transporter ATP-binding protein [Marinilactibacillus sp. Marseille-P9653]